MRLIVIILLIGAIGFAAWNYRQTVVERITPLIDSSPSEPSVQSPSGKNPAASSAPPQIAPPGVFYVKERFAVESETGIKALRPGEEVRLMYRHKDGRMLVTNGRYEFTVKPTVLTRDRTEALRAAPR